MKIDVVIPWVDGNDPALKQKRMQYGCASELSRTDVGGDTRYADLGEIHWCVRSINAFAPFINHIYIVTDGQDPHVQSRIPVSIVDHKVIFEGYEEYLPVFNSPAIEALIWKIPKLSEHFLLLNDDFMLMRPVSEEDFFTPDGKPLCYAKSRSTAWAMLLYKLSVLKYGYARATFKRALIKGCRKAGEKRRFIYLTHTPRPMLKSVFEDYFREHPKDIVPNIRHRFRSSEQFQVQSLHYALLLRRGLTVMKNPSEVLMFIQHWKGEEYITRKLRSATENEKKKFACFNSLDLASDQERELVMSWLHTTIPEH